MNEIAINNYTKATGTNQTFPEKLRCMIPLRVRAGASTEKLWPPTILATTASTSL